MIHYGAYNLQSGVYVVGTDAAEVQQHTGSRPSPISEYSYRRLDAYLPGFTDIVDLDAPQPAAVAVGDEEEVR